jgi:hypothetical protein
LNQLLAWVNLVKQEEVIIVSFILFFSFLLRIASILEQPSHAFGNAVGPLLNQSGKFGIPQLSSNFLEYEYGDGSAVEDICNERATSKTFRTNVFVSFFVV